jgi:hypothetical protein
MCVRAWEFTKDREREREVRDTLHTDVHCESKRMSSPNKNVLEDNTDLFGYSESSDANEEARNSN